MMITKTTLLPYLYQWRRKLLKLSLTCLKAARILGIAVPKFKIKKVAKTFPSELHEEHDDKHSFDENIETLIAVEDCSTKTDDEMAELIPMKVRKKKKERVVSNNYQCDVCSHKHGFASQHLLQKHLLKKHNLQITCPLCNGTFDQYEMFLKHKEACMPEIVCHVCGDNFKSKAALKYHIGVKHETKEKAPCQYCGEYFQDVSLHVKNIHENPIEKCNLCDFQSRRSYALNIHTKTMHSDINLKTCEFCGEVRKNLKKHIERTKCGQNINVEDRKDVSCDKCDSKFTTRVSLKKHLKAIHQKVRNRACLQCEYTTYSGYNLKIHVAKMHEGKRIEKETCVSCLKEVSNLPYHNKIYHLGQQQQVKSENL